MQWIMFRFGGFICIAGLIAMFILFGWKRGIISTAIVAATAF